MKSTLGAPTLEQDRRWDRLRRNGCHLCRMLDYNPQGGRTEIHHLTVGGKHGAPRLGHDFTIPLCEWHHRGLNLRRGEGFVSTEEMEAQFGPSYARTPAAFRSEYGSDEVLLAEVNRAIGWTEPPVRERKSKSQCTASNKQVRRKGQFFEELLTSVKQHDAIAKRGKKRGSKRGTHCTPSSKQMKRDGTPGGFAS